MEDQLHRKGDMHSEEKQNRYKVLGFLWLITLDHNYIASFFCFACSVFHNFFLDNFPSWSSERLYKKNYDRVWRGKLDVDAAQSTDVEDYK